LGRGRDPARGRPFLRLRLSATGHGARITMIAFAPSCLRVKSNHFPTAPLLWLRLPDAAAYPPPSSSARARPARRIPTHPTTPVRAVELSDSAAALRHFAADARVTAKIGEDSPAAMPGAWRGRSSRAGLSRAARPGDERAWQSGDIRARIWAADSRARVEVATLATSSRAPEHKGAIAQQS
jgi:hypothetical protein